MGIAGCGYWGPNLARNIDGARDAMVCALCDLSTERLARMRRLYPAAEVFDDFDEMLERVALDAVVVATPLKTHFKLAMAALRAGKHVLIEKPMAASSRECEELISVADKAGLVLMLGHTFLYSAAVMKIAEIVKRGDIGEVRYINARRLNLGLFQKDINVVWDLAPHDISIILHILEKYPLSVNCQGNAHVTSGVEDVANLSMLFEDNQFVTIQSSWLEPRKVREMTIVGSRGMIVYDDLQAQESIRIYDVRVERPPHYETFGEFQYSYHYGDSHIPYVRQTEPLKTECQHFVDCILSGAPVLTDGRAGLAVVKILEAASASLRSGGAPVAVSPPGAPGPLRSGAA